MQCLLEFDLLANRRRWQRKQDTLWVWQHLAPVVQHASSRRSSSSGHHFSAWNLKHTTVPRKIKENTTRATNVWRQAPRARHPRHGPSVTRGISSFECIIVNRCSMKSPVPQSTIATPHRQQRAVLGCPAVTRCIHRREPVTLRDPMDRTHLLLVCGSGKQPAAPDVSAGS
ncbi:uncharacterized protein LOC121834164 isoform X1 [Ixodes scapularis]|uniref:uncharacterized protein LOC121834164 isoform X1 n=1 Tax=Ixodes scapularis TaxID=6945 RepID=UPI001C38D668|nr:uncharacterized protein LOC121834164 isoform X1 [Ixodes scapularis]